jgi:SAM-dependent methyltransferase
MSAPNLLTSAGAKKLAEEILAVAGRARTEEDVRVNVEHALRPVWARLGITAEPFYEQRVTLLRGTGRADAVYGFGIIEYETPGKLATAAGQKEVIDQLSGYLAAKARELAPTKPVEAVKKMLGIGLDGRQVMYLRYAASENRARFFQPIALETQLSFHRSRDIPRGGFQIVGPMPVNEASVDWLLYSLRFFHRRALEPEGLAQVFGPSAELASATVNALYHKLLTAHNQRVSAFFAQWNMIFGVIYGQELEKNDAAAQELARLYKIQDKPDLKKLLFAVHTYYVLLMKLLAAELVSLREGSWFFSFSADVEAASEDALRSKFEHLENGGPFRQFNTVNFLEGDFFRWYLDVWDGALAQCVRHLAIALQQFEPATTTINPDAARDLLKKLYQYLLPRRVRHDLGEYYTPDWLADRLIRQTGYDGNPKKRVLDPSCGSGTFLTLCLRKAFDYADRHLVRPDELVGGLLANVVGFDLNPLAVIAARTNYLLALGPMIRRMPRVEIPVYLCDSILTPAEFAREGQIEFVGSTLREGGTELTLPNGRVWHVDTAEGRFTFPAAVVEKDRIEAVCALIEESVRLGRSDTEFVSRLRGTVGRLEATGERLLVSVFARIVRLSVDGKNGIWARFLKNQFAPVFVGTSGFDYVIGNPPWVNWQSLSDDYRAKTLKLWQDYGLFSLEGHAARLGGGKKDLAMLFTYACLDNYVRDGGRLGFIITQTLFKTKGAGDGFRRFQLGQREPFQVQQVDDLSEFQPFEGATNRTAIVTFVKGRATTYPVPYLYWRKKGRESVQLDDDLDTALRKVEVKQWQARPIDPAEATSPWLTARPKALGAVQKAIGQADYRAYAGSCTWANGVFWMEVTGRNAAGQVMARNLNEIGKLEGIPQIEHAFEPDLLFPLLRGRDVDRWRAAPSAYLLNVQHAPSRQGLDEKLMRQRYPATLDYLLNFRELLVRRSGCRKYFCKETGRGRKRKFEPLAPFYSLYNIGEYTLAPFKVCWPELSDDLRAGVAEPLPDSKTANKIVVPDHTVVFIPCTSREEAHFCCALLNSAPAGLAIASYITLHPSPHVLEHVRLPRFDAQNQRHARLSDLSRLAHTWTARLSTASSAALGELEQAASGYAQTLRELRAAEAEVDALAAQLWEISDAELRDIQTSLEDLR